MKAYEYAKENDMTTAEVKEKFNLASHMSLIPELVEDVVELIETVSKEVPTEDDPELLAEAHGLMGLIGWKTRAYLHFVNDHKELLPVEYQRVIHLIEQYLCK